MKRAPRKAIAPDQGGDASKAGRANSSCADYSSRSTATEAQIALLAILLRLRAHNTYELRSKGISHPAGRVLDLQKRGFVIGRHRINTVDRDGYMHAGVAVYEIVTDPQAGGCDE